MPLKARPVAPALALVCWLAAPQAFADGPTKEQCIAANEGAQDLRHAGKLREVRAQLSFCISDACPGPVREDCAQRLAEVDAVMPTVLFEVRDEGDRDLSSVKVTMDGQRLLDRLDGTAVPVDTGPHKFRFEAEGYRPESRDLVLNEGDKNRRERVVLVVAGAAAAAAPAGASAAAGGEEPGDGRVQRLIGLTVAGTGAVALVVGGVLGVLSKSTYDHALKSECGSAVMLKDPKACNSGGVSDVQTANTQATASTVAFIAGALLGGGGAYLYLTAPRGAGASVAPAVGLGWAGVRGTW